MILISSATSVVDILSTEDTDAWHSLLPTQCNVFGSVEFASITGRYLGYRGRLFAFTANGEKIVFPLLLRPISNLPFVVNAQREERWDAVSPDYTGPLAWRSVSLATAHNFQERLAECCQRERIIALFAHLHPWHWSPDMLETDNVFLDREIIYADLSYSEEQIWQRCLDRHCRKNVRKARRENVRVSKVVTVEGIEEFHRVYVETMRRNDILDRYYLPVEYFVEFFEMMPDNARFTLAKHNGQVVAGLLCLYDNVDVYAYRAGLDYAFQHVRPINALYYEAILWTKSRGKKRLVLGGGARPNDGIFRFKASFSPLRADFFVYKRICSIDDYVALCEDWSAYYSCDVRAGEYFPVYRSMPPH